MHESSLPRLKSPRIGPELGKSRGLWPLATKSSAMKASDAGGLQRLAVR